MKRNIYALANYYTSKEKMKVLIIINIDSTMRRYTCYNFDYRNHEFRRENARKFGNKLKYVSKYVEFDDNLPEWKLKS